eukprot:9436798-Alexandrium_andersonii.AAC.1
MVTSEQESHDNPTPRRLRFRLVPACPPVGQAEKRSTSGGVLKTNPRQSRAGACPVPARLPCAPL